MSTRLFGFSLAAAAALGSLVASAAPRDRGRGRNGRDAVSGAAAALVTPACTPTWNTVDDFLPPGSIKSAAGAVLTLPFGSTAAAIVAGSTYSANDTGNWVVRDGIGQAWITVENRAAGPGLIAHPDGIARDAATRRVYVVGGENVPGSNAGPWVVRSSGNAISGWRTVDTFVDAAYPAALGHAAVVDATGHALVGGAEAQAADGNYHWVVRESADDGATWAISDDEQPIRFSNGVYAMAADQTNGNVYAAGYDFDGFRYHWKVRLRSAGAWGTVEDFVFDGTSSSQGTVPFAATVTDSGAVIVAGVGRDGAGINHWIVRRSQDAGASWTTVDDLVASAGGTHCKATGATFDAGTILVTGECRDGGVDHWVTRASTDDGTTWATEDDFQLAPGVASTGNDISSASGVAYAVGRGTTAAGVAHWVTRRRICH